MVSASSGVGVSLLMQSVSSPLSQLKWGLDARRAHGRSNEYGLELRGPHDLGTRQVIEAVDGQLSVLGHRTEHGEIQLGAALRLVEDDGPGDRATPLSQGLNFHVGVAAHCHAIPATSDSGDNIGRGGDLMISESASMSSAHPGIEPAEGDAWLWSPPDQIVAELPTRTELESLPLDKLTPRNAERLFLCLLEAESDVTYAKSYGLPGQEQEGIDVYGRLRVLPVQPEVPADNRGGTGARSHGHDRNRDRKEVIDDKQGEQADIAATSASLLPRRYVTLQSKRVKDVAPSDIKNAVNKFLEGSWPEQCTVFYYATTFDFRQRNLDQAIRDATDLLQAKGVEFIPWDAERVNELLRDQPRLVGRFFGPDWVGPFCGPDKAKELPAAKLDATETRLLRSELRGLYQAAFAAFASLRPTDLKDGGSFVVLDALPRTESQSLTWEDTGHAAPPVEHSLDSPDPVTAKATGESDAVTPSALRRPRRSLRSVRALVDDRRGPNNISDALPADEWLAGGSRSLLIGIPGAGKSSLLRFIATDLLAAEPASVAIQRSHGDRLPVWLPFGFLCHHLDTSDSNSLTSAVQAWLTSRSRPDLYPLVQKALEDDRLLLLIDGIDEWTTESTANRALGAVETFLGYTEASVVLTSRPYALARLPFNLTWRRADIAPLDSEQQRRVASQYLVPAEHTAAADDPSMQEAPHAAMWSRTNVEPFLAQLTDVPELQTFASTPLLLALLAKSWRGEPLPPRRFDLYNLIVKMLVDTHPKMRARASRATELSLNASDFLTLIQAVAYRLKADETPQPVPTKTMQKLMEFALADEEILGYDKVEARKMAIEAMAMAEDEFGILVPQGAKHVGFIHRVIGDHLAGCHLPELEPEHQLQTFADKHKDAAWTDVLLAALNAQPNKHTVAQTLHAIIDGLVDVETVSWPENLLSTQATWRFIGAALAADAKLAPREIRELLDALIDEVETSPSLTYRDDIVTILVQASSIPTIWRHLHPVFQRWLNATRPVPSAAILALRNLSGEYDHRVRRIITQALRHEDGRVRSAAVDTYVARYGNPEASTPSQAAPEVRPVDPALVELIKEGPDTQTQCAALMALVEGWPTDHVTLEHVGWARQSPKTNLRTVALFAVAKLDTATPLRDLFEADEHEFVMAHLYDEGRLSDDHEWTGLNAVLVTRAVSEASGDDKKRLAEFAVTTMQQNPMGDGNRAMCWQLACGPLADHEPLRDWVIEELNNTSNKFPLILYDLNRMPSAWTAHQPMKDAIHGRIDDLSNAIWNNYVKLTRVLPDEQARTALLKAIDDSRPSAAAHELVERFGDDPVVSRELDKRFAHDKSAAALAAVAIKHLGPVAGFDRIYKLLNDFNATKPITAVEAHVVVAQSVAYGWHDFKQAVAGEKTDTDAKQAAEVLATYEEDDVAAVCLAVPTRRGLGWHIAEIVNTWPKQGIDYTLAELRSNHHITHGLNDPIHSLALLAHASKPSPRSDEVLDLALDLLTPLPPALREVLAYELTQAPITPTQLLDVTSPWMNDPDAGIRRITAIGITRAVLRHHLPDTPRPVELDAWRETVRRQLCAYGPSHEEDRQIAWACMLLLGAPELLDGQLESIGEPTPPGVRLTDIYGNPDELLVELIAQSWDTLLPHLGEMPIRRLTDARPKADEAQALRSLMGKAKNYPAVAEFLHQRIAAEEADGPGSATRKLLETTCGGIDYLIATHGRTAATLELVINASGPDIDSIGDRLGVRERWAFTHLTQPWDIPDYEREAILRDASVQGEGPTDGPSAIRRRSTGDGSVARAAHDMLYPTSEAALHHLDELTRWFDQPEEKRPEDGPMTWLEAVVLTFLTTPAGQLPYHIERIFHLRRLEVADEPTWKFTTPLLHRLANDPEAIQALIGALDGTTPDATSPLFDSPAPQPGQEQADTARRVFLLAGTLKAAGHLTPARLATAIATLRGTDPRTTMTDPFIGVIGPLRTLAAPLAEGLSN